MVDELIFIHDGDLRRLACVLRHDERLSMAQLRLGTYMFGPELQGRLVRLEGVANTTGDKFNGPIYSYVPWRMRDPFA